MLVPRVQVLDRVRKAGDLRKQQRADQPDYGSETIERQ